MSAFPTDAEREALVTLIESATLDAQDEPHFTTREHAERAADDFERHWWPTAGAERERQAAARALTEAATALLQYEKDGYLFFVPGGRRVPWAEVAAWLQGRATGGGAS